MNQLEQVLTKLGRPARVGRVVEAPQVWRVELTPLHRVLTRGNRGQMTQVAHLRRLQDDIALGLGVESVSFALDEGLWLEVPKQNRDMVRLGDVEAAGGLPWVLGRSVTGESLSLDLTKPESPHILVAGTTGSGKTVALKAGIAGLIERRSPDDVRLILIDTKHELRVFKDAAHVAFVCSGVDEAVATLNGALANAEARYVSGLGAVKPRWVIVIDEFADLVLGNKDVEKVMVRLAQKVRAAGTHLVIATQRPSVDVVTGLIKANFPVRVAFQTVSKVDSEVVLDVRGAERLLGCGDGLLMMQSRVTRFQGAFINDNEIERCWPSVRPQVLRVRKVVRRPLPPLQYPPALGLRWKKMKWEVRQWIGT